MIYGLSAVGTLSFICSRQQLKGRRRAEALSIFNKLALVNRLARAVTPFVLQVSQVIPILLGLWTCVPLWRV